MQIFTAIKNIRKNTTTLKNGLYKLANVAEVLKTSLTEM